jgi:hypothetical protein
MSSNDLVSEKLQRQASRSRRLRLGALGLSLAFAVVNVLLVPAHAYTRYVVMACVVSIGLSWCVLRLLRCPRCGQYYFRKRNRPSANIMAVECENCRYRL